MQSVSPGNGHASTPRLGPLYGLTGRRNKTVEVPFRFLENVHYHPECDGISGEDTITSRYGPVRSEPGREKWLYIFNCTPGGRVDVQYEGSFDEEGSLRLVDWSDPQKHEGKDERPAAIGVGDTLPITFSEGLEGNPDPLDESFDLYAMLSHVQLSAYRLEQYTGAKPAFFEARCRKFGLHDLAFSDEGNPDLKPHPDLKPRDIVWVNGEGVPNLLLTDYVGVAEQLHTTYEAAAAQVHGHAIKNAAKIFHGGITRTVAESYRESEDADQAPGQVLEQLGSFEEGVQEALQGGQANVEKWSEILYDHWMQQPAFQLAREDATTFAADLAKVTGEKAREKIDIEVARQADLLDGAGQSEHGKAYLKEFLGSPLGGASKDWKKRMAKWYYKVAMGSSIVKKLSSIPKTYFSNLKEKAKVQARNAEEALNDLHARRLRTYSLYLTSLEHTRWLYNPGPRRDLVVERQIRILRPLYEAVRPGRRVALPGEPEFEQMRSRVVKRGTEGTGGHSGRGAGPSQAMPAWKNFGPGLNSGSDLNRTLHNIKTNANDLQLKTLEVPPQALARDSLGRTQYRYSNFSFEANERGLLVLTNGREQAALANADRLPSKNVRNARPAQTVEEVSLAHKRAGYVRGLWTELLLEDSRGQESTPTSRQRRMGELRRKIQSQDSALKRANLEVELYTKRINYAGRFLAVLDVLDLVTSAFKFWEKIEQGEKLRERGKSWWESYGGAVASGTGMAGGLAGTVESLEYVLPTAWRGAKGAGISVAMVLKVCGVVAAVAGLVVSGFKLSRESERHDEVGMAAFGLSMASSVVVLISFFVAGAFLGLALGLVGIALGLLSVLFFFFTDTKLEEWLKNCYWSRYETEEVRKLEGEELADRLCYELDDLFKLLVCPQVSVEFWSEGRRMADYHSAVEDAPVYLRLVLRPGLAPPGTRYRITDFRLVPPGGLFSEGEPAVIEKKMQIPNPQRDVVLLRRAEAESGRSVAVPEGYLRQWRLKRMDLGEDVDILYTMPPVAIHFEAQIEVDVRATGEENSSLDSTLDQTYRVRGPLAYQRFGRLYPSKVATREIVEE